MTGPGPMRRWDPLRPLDMVGALWSSASALPPVSTGTSAAYRTLFMTIRRLVVGRTVTVRLDSGDLRMTVTEFDSRLDVRKLAVGQLDDVRISADEIIWGTSGFDHATAKLHNVHVRPGAPPVLIAAPVELSLDVPTATVDELLLGAMPRLLGQVDDTGIARLFWGRRLDWGNLEVDAELDGSVLSLRARAVTVRSRRLALPLRTPAYRVQLPELPHGLQLTGVRFEPGLLRLTGTVPEWHLDFSRRRVETALQQLSTAGLLTLGRAAARPPW